MYTSLIKESEQCRLQAYLCPAGKWTIGWGNTYYANYNHVKKGDCITQQQADTLLQWYVEHEIKLPKGNFNFEQKVALYSLIYNVGQHSFDKSKCKKAIENQDWKTAFKEWDWIYVNGKISNGLVKRRKKETDLFFKGLF